MCVDYTDLDKAYPKDNYHLPRIDQLVDSIFGHEVLFFFWMPTMGITKSLCTLMIWEKNGFHHYARNVLLQGNTL